MEKFLAGVALGAGVVLYFRNPGPRTSVCPECKGTGRKEYMYPLMGISRDGIRKYTSHCDKCGGIGKVLVKSA